MANTDEPTKPIDDPKDYETKPILAAILERINAVGDELTAFRQDVNTRFSEVNTRLEAIEKTITRLGKKIDVLTLESMTVKAGILDHEERLEELERQAS